MKVYFLGTGTSQGIPVIGFDHPVGQSEDKRNIRLRTSILITWDNLSLLIDCGPDFRQQMFNANCKYLDAILVTHEHADHIAGLDEIRPLTIMHGPLPIYGLPRVITALEKRYDYIFTKENRYPGAPAVIEHKISSEEPFFIKGKEIIPIDIMHGPLPILGFRIDDFVYITDAKEINEENIAKIKGCKVLVINALRIKEHPMHFNLEQALTIVEQVAPEKAYLTHISQDLGFHAEVEKTLPNNVYLAFDNLQIEI